MRCWAQASALVTSPATASACWSNCPANPTGPLHVGHGRQAAIGDAISNLFSTQGWSAPRVLLQRRRCADRHLTKSTQLRAKGFKPGDDCWPTDSDNPLAKNFYNGDYIADIVEAFKAKATVKADDREFTANGDVDDYDNIRQFAVAYLRNEQDKTCRHSTCTLTSTTWNRASTPAAASRPR